MEFMPNRANIVLLASNHSPGIVSKEWLNQKGIVTETPEDFTNTPEFSAVETANYLVQVDPQRLNIDLKNPDENMLTRLPVMATQYIEALPEVPYRLVGLNFNWIVQLGNLDVLKSIFIANPEHFNEIFPEGDYYIGGIVLYDYNAFGLRLIIQPENDNNVLFAFNYYSDVSNINDLSSKISQFSEVTKHARTIVTKLLGGE